MILTTLEGKKSHHVKTSSTWVKSHFKTKVLVCVLNAPQCALNSLSPIPIRALDALKSTRGLQCRDTEHNDVERQRRLPVRAPANR